MNQRSSSAPTPASAPLPQGNAAVYSCCRFLATELARPFSRARPLPTWCLQASGGSAGLDSPSEAGPPPPSRDSRWRSSRRRSARRAQVRQQHCRCAAALTSEAAGTLLSGPVRGALSSVMRLGRFGQDHQSTRAGSGGLRPCPFFLLHGAGLIGPLVASVVMA
ncbi:hypothetical protein NDU88_004228 [Pleurodeles waltl]|uniref:Uncharacterized protein n=1 Tax=Pleurodeles waltl TaxID=8319 RepID=A0AAV7WUH1_PLEWA|nr:hypothetical protein NDU88_004228 [Pleurodeles waltl]